MKKQRVITTPPDTEAVIRTPEGKRLKWPAYRSNNTRFMVTVPCVTLDPAKDVAQARHVHITHQPTGKAAVLGVPFKVARKMSAVCYALFGDVTKERELLLIFASLPPEVQQWLRRNWQRD